MPTRSRHLNPARSVGCGVQLLCLTCLVALSQLVQLSFLHGIGWSGEPVVTRQLTARFSQRHGESPNVDAAKNARALSVKLTLRIKKAQSAKALIEVLDEILDGPFDFYQASSSYHSLATLKRRRGLQRSDWDSPVIARLHARVGDLVLQDELGPRELSNVLWSIATLSDRFSIPTELLDALVKSLAAKAEGMDPQGLSNSLWAFAQLKEVAPDVLKAVPDIAAQIIGKARDMKPQELSNCLYACGLLEDNAWEVLKIVLPVAAEASVKIKDMKTQEISNSLQALVPLQESVPEVSRLLADDDGEEDILRSAVARFNTLQPRLTGKDLSIHLPVTVWACAKLGMYPDDLLRFVSQDPGFRKALSRLPGFSLCALAWSYQVLDAQDDYADFRGLLKSEALSRGLSEADIESTRLGHLKWNHAQL